MKRQVPTATPVTCEPSPAVTSIEINDPTAVGEDMQVIAQEAVQLEPKPLRARRVVVRLGSSLLLLQSTNLPIRTRTTLRGGLVAYVAFGPRASGSLNGLPVGPDRVLASTSGVEVEFVVAAGYESVSLLVPPAEVRRHLGRPPGEDQHLVPKGVQLLRTSPGAGSRLFAWGRRVASAAAKYPEAFDDPRTNSVAQRELLEILIATIGSAVVQEGAPREGTRRAYSRIVRIAEEYAITHAGEPLYLNQLCRAASVSERTLQNAFNEIMGMSPVAYLARLRLHRLRQALRAAAPRSTTVTAEALKWGFWHLGDCSREYRECFGELPSATLRRLDRGR